MFLLDVLLLLPLTLPDTGISTTVCISNLLSEDIVSMHYILPASTVLSSVSFSSTIGSNSMRTVELPYVYINHIFWETTSGGVYSLSGYAPGLSVDTIEVSPAKKEFGGVFNRIYGSNPLNIVNSTDVPLVSVELTGNFIPSGNLMRNKIFLPSEFLRVWIDSGETVEITAIDSEGNSSIPFAASTATPDSIYRITPEMFFSNGDEIGYSDSQAGSWVINSITLGRITLIEAFSSNGYLIDGLDCSSSPLNTWDKVYIHHNAPIDFIILTDENGRTFSANAVDSLTGSFIVGDFNLDFGFDFP
ncbi:MAG: hypothetical protein K8S62_03090 [Candidatus Sabulitectum sp.]|nr:hypothetical protein [Candidatus Sabulitectum sp.]